MIKNYSLGVALKIFWILFFCVLMYSIGTDAVIAAKSKSTFFDWVETSKQNQKHGSDEVSNILLSLNSETDYTGQNPLRKFWSNIKNFNYDDPMMVHLVSKTLENFPQDDLTRSEVFSHIDFTKLKSSCESDSVISKFSKHSSHKNYASDLVHLKKIKQKLIKRSFAFEMIKDYQASHPEKLKRDLWQFVKDDHVFLRKNPWLYLGQKELSAYHALEFKVRAQLSKRNCKLAEKTLRESAIHDSSIEQWVGLGNRVYKCLKRKGRKKVTQFFDRYANILYKKFSNAGWSAAKLRHAKYLWGSGDFAGSKNMIQSVIKLAKSKNEKSALGDAKFLLGEVVQNEGDDKESRQIFESFRKNHPSHKSYGGVLKKLVVLEASQKNWLKVKSIAKELEALGERLAVGEPDPSELAFGRFWQSVAMHNLNDHKGATKIWQKLSSESFSSYYGAVSSYMLEKYNVLSAAQQQVGKDTTFSHGKYLNSFDPEQKKTLSYAQKLIRLGYKDSAACELNHMPTDDLSHEQKMFLSAMLYLSDDWLSMVIKFNSIPRFARKQFPIGVETMMFPKKFDDQISKYAKKLGLEDEFIMAIIRQESIFNPKAKSWAGARGLMQLMPMTARREAKKIGKGYLEPQVSLGLKSLKKSKDKLFDHHVNIALGIHHVKSLFDTYKSPLFVLTSYNASPSATKRWKRNITFDDKLLFIEKIPYKETRSYAKLVFRNYYYYKKLYKPSSSPKLLSKILGSSFPALKDKGGIQL